MTLLVPDVALNLLVFSCELYLPEDSNFSWSFADLPIEFMMLLLKLLPYSALLLNDWDSKVLLSLSLKSANSYCWFWVMLKFKDDSFSIISSISSFSSKSISSSFWNLSWIWGEFSFYSFKELFSSKSYSNWTFFLWSLFYSLGKETLFDLKLLSFKFLFLG